MESARWGLEQRGPEDGKSQRRKRGRREERQKQGEKGRGGKGMHRKENNK